MIEDLLVRANLPIEVLALSLNILSKFVRRPTLDVSTLKDLPLDLLIVATLSLASIYTNDHPPSSSHWASEVAIGSMTGKQIDKTSLAIMSAVDWRIHDCSDGASLVQALRLFERRDLQPSLQSQPLEHYEEPCLKPKPLCLKIAARNDDAACWVNGQLTPGNSSTCSALEDHRTPFLPLL